MAIINSFPQGTVTRLTLKSSAVDLNPLMGGPSQRVSRLADRWVLEVEMRTMDARQAGPIANALLLGLSETVTVPVHQGVDTSDYVDPTVSVYKAAGTNLEMTGINQAPFVGQMFSIVKGGKRYLHRISAVTSNSNVTIFPALKTAIDVGDVLEFQNPKIEGFIEGNEQPLTIGLLANLGISFRIIEAN